jgi:peptide/nickel transport system permease protein
MAAPIGELEVPGDPPLPAGVPASQIQGRSPWYLAWLRLRRNKVALACGGLFVLIVLFCLAAPLWAEHVAHTGPNANHITEKVMIDDEPTNVVATDGTPIGPGLRGQFLLGADQNGRDVMVRLMYGGRTSIYIGLAAAAVTTVLSVIVGLLAGYYRGWIDSVLSRIMDVIWAFPVLLLGISLGTTLAIGGLKLGPLAIAGDSIWIPILIIGLVYVPYMARPIRGEILALHHFDDHRLLHAQHRQQHAAGVGAVVPRCRRAPTQCLVGHDDRRRLRNDLHGTTSDDRARTDDHRHRAVPERIR